MLDWLHWYNDPLFISFPIATMAVSLIAFSLFAAPLTWIAFKRPRWAEKYRIQERPGNAAALIGPSVRFYLLNGTILAALLIGLWPLLRLTQVHAGPLPPWYTIVLQIVFFIYFEDLLFYLLHRALHTKRLYRRIHAIHHRNTVTWAIAGNYMHPAEFAAIAACVLAGPLLLGSHVFTIWIWIAFRQWLAANEHCGYEFPWNPNRLFPFYDGASFHDFHHSRFKGNYGAFTGLWDRMFGTLSPGYREHLRQRDERRTEKREA